MVMPVKTVTQPKLQSAVLKYFCHADFNFEQDTLLAGSGAARSVELGTVLGKILTGAIAVGTVTFSGTGNGVLTKATPAYSAAAKAGNYLAVFTAPVTNLGDFMVFRPDGSLDGRGRVGVAYDGQVKFTIADGAIDFIAGDTFTLPVTVAAGSLKVVPLDLAATDGSQNAYGIAARPATAPDAVDAPIVTLPRGPAVLLYSGVIYPAAATSDQIAAINAQLAALGILVRAD